eukprot:498265_1
MARYSMNTLHLHQGKIIETLTVLKDIEPVEHATEIDKNVNNTINVSMQSWSSLICHIIPLALLMFIYAVVDSSLMVLIPLYTRNAFISGLIITFQGVGLVIASPFIGYLISITSTEFC